MDREKHAMTAAKRQQLARLLDTRVRYLRLTGLDDTALIAAMSATGWPTSRPSWTPPGRPAWTVSPGACPTWRHYAALLSSVAVVARDDTIKVLE